jgi:hypothetical protein
MGSGQPDRWQRQDLLAVARGSGRPFSIALEFLPTAADQGVILLSFNETNLMQRNQEGLGTVEMARSGTIPVPIVDLEVDDVLQTFSQSQPLTVATQF